MRPSVIALLIVGACETAGQVVIDDDAVEDTEVSTDTPDAPGDEDPSGDDTEPGSDTDDSKPPTPDDTDALPDDGTGGTSPFDAARLAWDGVVRVTHKPYIGPDCIVQHVERGEEIGPGALRDRLAGACPTCQRFFEVTDTENGWCLTTYRSGSWRGLELRPTGEVVATWLGEDERGTLGAWVQGTGRITGDQLTFARNANGFPFNSVEQIRATITLTAIP